MRKVLTWELKDQWEEAACEMEEEEEAYSTKPCGFIRIP